MASESSYSSPGNYFELNPNAPVFRPACRQVIPYELNPGALSFSMFTDSGGLEPLFSGHVSADINALADGVATNSILNPDAPVFSAGHV